MRKTIIYIMTLVTGVAVTSCRNDFDFDTAHNTYSETVQQYNESFTSVYGNVPADMNWDMSSYAANNGNGTRATINTNDANIKIETEVAGIDYQAGTNNFNSSNGSFDITTGKNSSLYNFASAKSYSGTSETLTAPNNSFTIYPLTAQTDKTYKLMVKVGDEAPVEIFTKGWTYSANAIGNGMKYKVDKSETTTTYIRYGFYSKNLSKYLWQSDVYKLEENNKEVKTTIDWSWGDNNNEISNYNGKDKSLYYFNCDKKQTHTDKTTTYSLDNNVTASMPGVTISAPAGTPIEIYLEVNGEKVSNSKVLNSSLKASDIDVPVKTNDAKLKFIGFDDVTNGDNDYNDLVLMIVGNSDVPGPLTTKTETKVVTISKRYMVEDLGATAASDIDFNDLVVDLISYEEHTITTTNGKVTADVRTGITKQEAIVRALGGTLDVNFIVGATTSIYRKGIDEHHVTGTMYNTGFLGKYKESKGIVKLDAELVTTPIVGNVWDPSTNNVWVEVIKKVDDGKNEERYSIKFPENGSIPQMIAVDVTQPWSREGVKCDFITSYIEYNPDSQTPTEDVTN